MRGKWARVVGARVGLLVCLSLVRTCSRRGTNVVGARPLKELPGAGHHTCVGAEEPVVQYCDHSWTAATQPLWFPVVGSHTPGKAAPPITDVLVAQ